MEREWSAVMMTSQILLRTAHGATMHPSTQILFHLKYQSGIINQNSQQTKLQLPQHISPP